MAEDTVTRNLQHMDELDFTGWNGADWEGVFAHRHTDDVFVKVNGSSTPSQIPSDRFRIRRVDLRGGRAPKRRPDGNRGEVARRSNRRGIRLDIEAGASAMRVKTAAD